MQSKWFRFSKKAKIVLAGVVTADLALIISWLSDSLNNTAVIIGLLGATIPPLLGYWTSND